MPLFRCSVCGNAENTALSNYWTRYLEARPGEPKPAPLCSACDPAIGRWHGQFQPFTAAGMLEDARGYLYHSEAEAVALNARPPLRRVGGGQ